MVQFIYNTDRTNFYIKKRIKGEQLNEQLSYTNDLYVVLMSKNNIDFWKTWKSKFKKFQSCHPIIMCILYQLFNLFIMTGHIPEDFGASYTVPISKCDGRVCALSVDDFRGLSISPVISKLFEMAIQNKFAPFSSYIRPTIWFQKAYWL